LKLVEQGIEPREADLAQGSFASVSVELARDMV
jgi:hypothetical protein